MIPRNILFNSLIVWLFLIHPNLVQATALLPEDLAETYVNEELGVSVKVPHTWDYETSGGTIEKARAEAQKLTGRVMGIPQEEVHQIDLDGSEKSILIRMHGKVLALPAAQVTTRSFKGVSDPPSSSLEHLKGYLQFVQGMMRIDIVEPLDMSLLNDAPCAHVAYNAEIMLEGYTYLARYDVYSFWRKDRTIDLTVIQDRNNVFKAQDEMDIHTILNSFRVEA